MREKILLGVLLLFHGSAPAAPSSTRSPSLASVPPVYQAVLVNALEKPRPNRIHRGGSQSIALTSAKNEYESFQVILNGPLTVTAVAPPVFTLVNGTATGETVGTNATALPQSMVYAARYVTAVTESGCEGKAGQWLDPLVPDIDVHYHEKRNAFPITVPANETRVVWLDVFVPAAAQSGVYTSSVIVTLAKAATATPRSEQGAVESGTNKAKSPSSNRGKVNIRSSIPPRSTWVGGGSGGGSGGGGGAIPTASTIELHANLTVYNFKLPSTPPLVSMFGFRGYSDVMASHQASPATAQELVRMYVLTGLANRITLGNWIANGNASDVEGAGNVSSLNASSEWTAPDGDDGAGDAFDSWATVHAPLFDGIAVPGPNNTASLLDARLTSVQLPARECSLRANRTGTVLNCSSTDVVEQIEYWRSMHAAWKSRNWASLLFDYTIDEPADFDNASLPTAWAVVKERVAWLKAASTELRSLVTTQMPDAIAANATDQIDIWVPLVNFMNVKPVARPHSAPGNALPRQPAATSSPPSPFTKVACHGKTTGDQRSQYANVTKPHLWSYQSCMSYGCGPKANCAELNKTQCSLGWVSYAIDHSGVRNRAMEWASYVEDIGGELYYETVPHGGPDGQYGWGNALRYGGNGDGYLMYPGFANGTNASKCASTRKHGEIAKTHEGDSNGTGTGTGTDTGTGTGNSTGCEYAIGGVHDIPIESVRLKHVRDGFEDNAWLQILEGLAGRATVTRLIHPFMNCAWNFVNDPGALLSIRSLVGEAIEAHIAAKDAAAR